MTHGGRALLNFYIEEGSVCPYPPSDEFVDILANSVSLSHIAVAVALDMANNVSDPGVQRLLQRWHDEGIAFLHKCQAVVPPMED